VSGNGVSGRASRADWKSIINGSMGVCRESWTVPPALVHERPVPIQKTGQQFADQRQQGPTICQIIVLGLVHQRADPFIPASHCFSQPGQVIPGDQIDEVRVGQVIRPDVRFQGMAGQGGKAGIGCETFNHQVLVCLEAAFKQWPSFFPRFGKLFHGECGEQGVAGFLSRSRQSWMRLA